MTTPYTGDAEAAMGPNAWVEGGGPWSVMNKSMVGPSGDYHDYFSIAKCASHSLPFLALL